MFGGSFRVARFFGVDIELHPSWFLILVLLGWSLSASVFPELYEDWSGATYWVIGVSSALLFFGTVLVHELAHAVVALRRGLEVDKITLFIFGGVSHLEDQPRSAGEEFQVAIAGPATSFLIALVMGLGYLVVLDRQEQAEALFGYLALVNGLLFFFNILPGFPLDGGRVFRAAAWRFTGSFKKATRLASSVGQMFGWGLILAGVAFLFGGLWFNGIWFMLIGWFLLGSARAEAMNLQYDSVLKRLTARDVMHEEWATVPPGTSLQVVADDYMVARGERALVVALGDTVHGLITVEDLRRIPRDEWLNTPAQRVMTPREQVTTVEAISPAVEVLMTIGRLGLEQVPVIDNGRMVGIISRRELVDRIQLAEALAPEPDENGPEPPEPPATPATPTQNKDDDA